MNNLFPIFLKLENLKLLIVGGGFVGLEKLTGVLKNSPQTSIILVAPEIREEIVAFSSSYPNLTLVYEKYHSRFLEDKDLVIIGTNDKAVNLKIKEDCKAKRILANVADTPDLCDFYLSSVVQKGDLKIAISTNGKSPTFAKRFREALEEMLPDTLQETLENLQQIRNSLKGDFQAKLEYLNEITNSMKIKKK